MQQPSESDRNCSRTTALPQTWPSLQETWLFLPAVLTHLEEAGLPLERAFAILDKAKSNLDSIAGQKGLLLQNKFNSVLERNPDVRVLRSIVGCLKGKEEDSLPEGFSPGDVTNFKVCPTTNVDVERTFSVYKTVDCQTPLFD